MIIPIDLFREDENFLVRHFTTAAAAAATAAGAVAAACDGAFVAEPDCEAEGVAQRSGQSEGEQDEEEEVVEGWRSDGTHACRC